MSAAARLPIGTLLQEAAQVIGNVANAKTIYDAGIALSAAIVCYMQ